jgi:hypothetical protein
MMEFDAFRGITRRALSINYIAPAVCELVSEASGSGSGVGISATLGIDATNRLSGPELLIRDGNFLSWSAQPYIFAYAVYFASAEEGPFSLLTSNVLETHFDISGLSPGTYFFKVTGIEPDAGETFPSPTIEVTLT